MAQPADDRHDERVSGERAMGHPVSLDHGRRGGGGAGSVGLSAASGVIGSEFLPHLDEGAIWVRGTLAPSTGPTEGARRDGPGAGAFWRRFPK